MNSAMIQMNVATNPAAACASTEPEAAAEGAFPAALSALLESAAPPATEAAAALPEAGADAAALAIISGMLQQNPAPAPAPPPATDGQDPSLLAKELLDEMLGVDAAGPASARRAAVATGGQLKQESPDDILAEPSTEPVQAQDVLKSDQSPAALSAPVPVNTAGTAGASMASAHQTVAAAAHLVNARESMTTDLSTSAPHPTLREPVGSPRWAEEVGARLVMMSARGQQEGSLTLTPEHLGPLEVQISVSKDTANVWFGAQHADTRAALTEAMPRLRELLAASGLSLGQAGVSEHAPRQSPSEASARGAGTASAETAPVESAAAAWRPMRSSLIDTYA